MSAVRLTRRTVPVIAALVVLAAVGASVATASEAPRWNVLVASDPTHIDPHVAKNEVQQVAVSATGGSFVLIEERTFKYALFPWDASAAEVQTGLEGIYGAGNVRVSGGPGDETASKPYLIEFTGALAYQPVEPINTSFSQYYLSCEGATGSGCKHEATLTEEAKGTASGQLIVTATNVGGAATDGSTIALADVLPSAVTVTKVTGYDTYAAAITQGGEISGESPAGSELTCAAPPSVRCTSSKAVDPGDQLVMTVTFAVSPETSENVGEDATVTGGGAQSTSSETPIVVTSTPAGFGPAPQSAMVALSTTQAGAHPNVTTAFTMDTSKQYSVATDAKDIRFDLPPGLVGSTVGMPRCAMSIVLEAFHEDKRKCPADTMVGTATFTLGENSERPTEFLVPVYNIVPSPGEPAAFAFDAVLLPVRLDTSVLSNGNYAVRVTAPSLAESAQVISSWVTIWGVPAEHSGPGKDNTYIAVGEQTGETFGGRNPGQSLVPLLTNPQQCAEPLVGTMSADPWEHPGGYVSEQVLVGAVTGCDLVPFFTSFTMLPDTLEAGAPAGYSFNLFVPQHNEAEVLATSAVKDVSLSLPEGVVVNPSAAWGLKACSTSQFYGPGHPSQEPAVPSKCPREALVGEVEVETPDLEHSLKGDVFLGTPECDPCTPGDAADGRMVRLFIQLVGEGESGIVVKLEGHSDVDQSTGRITAVFQETPQLPFSHMRFVLEGGPRAVLANPRKCGLTKSVGDLTPWSTGVGVSDSTPFYEFEINENCFGSLFNPSFVAGTTDIQAGEYSPFTLSFGRSDNEGLLSGFSQTMPPGLLGKLAGVELCKEPQAALGTCGEGSLIGHTQVLTGPGADPFLVTGGKVFLTESYKGAPFGLSIVVPAVAGPYTLSGTTGQGTVVVRAKIEVDPTDAHLTVTADALPTMLDGIPLQLKVVNVIIDRPNFTFNPTSCGKLSIGAKITSLEGATANVSSPFQVTNCASLSFKPSFSVSTSGQTSRANGASLHVKLAYPNAPFGSQANIGSVKVDLPKQLPSRLTTLQKACPDSTFEANPAACSSASRIGTAKATTPLIPVPLEGPVYFVSHGGAKFPELIIALSGYGVTVDLRSETFINKEGITSSTFRTIPDVPVGTFELTLAEGADSALAANGNLCSVTRTVLVKRNVRVKSKNGTRTVTRKVRTTVAGTLVMPTAFTAQNGAVIHENTPIEVTGCGRAKKSAHHAKHKTKKK